MVSLIVYDMLSGMKAGLVLSLRQVTCLSAPFHFHLVVLQFLNIHLRTLWKWGFAWPDQEASQGLLKNQFLWSFPLSACCVTCCVILVNDLRKKRIKILEMSAIIKFGVFAFKRTTVNGAKNQLFLYAVCPPKKIIQGKMLSSPCSSMCFLSQYAYISSISAGIGLYRATLKTFLVEWSILELCRRFIKGRALGKLTGCERDLGINLPGCFCLLKMSGWKTLLTSCTKT